jgi:drug/metabolite transporter (DMT)-like permease
MSAMATIAATTSVHRRGIVAVCLATCVWATGTVIVKGSGIGGLEFAMFRLWAGVLVSATALLVTRRRVSWATFLACAPGGLLFATDIGLGFTAVNLTSIADVALIGALAPVVIVIVSAVRLGERLSRRDAALTAASFVGVVVVAVGSSGRPTWSLAGDLFALIGVGVWTTYWFFTRRARESTGPIEYFGCVMLAGAVAITPVVMAVEGGITIPAARDLVSVAAVALFPGFVGHTLMIWAHKHVESWLAALITQCTSVLSVLLAWLILDEAVPALVAVGGALVLTCTGVVIAGAARRTETADLDEAAEKAT